MDIDKVKRIVKNLKDQRIYVEWIFTPMGDLILYDDKKLLTYTRNDVIQGRRVKVWSNSKINFFSLRSREIGKSRFVNFLK
jgi:hypothetical protein